jgi:hypothetical protein
VQTSKSSQYALSICVAVVMLVGCNSATNVTPPQGNGALLNPGRELHAIPYGLGALKPHRYERLNGSGFANGSCSSIGVGYAKGSARGPYRGTFTGAGKAYGNWCGRRQQGSFSGIFTITSGSNTISGTFDGDIKHGGCSRVPRGRGGYECGVEGPLTYSATVEPGGKTLSGKGSGFLYGNEDYSDGGMRLTLRHM